MPEAKDTPSAPSSAAATRSGAGFELRLERGGAYLRLAAEDLAPGVRLESLTLQIPDVKFPFNVGQGAGQFRHRLSELVELSAAIDPAAAEEALASAGLALLGVEEARLAARDGFVEIAGRLAGGPVFTLEAGLLPAGELGVAPVFHSPRVLGPAPVPCAALPHLARAALEAMGTEAVPREPLGPLLRRALVPRGWKLPRPGAVRLARAEVAAGAVRVAWDRAAAGPAAACADPDLLAADEGARAFAEAEALVARGDFAAAREAYLAITGAAAAHPFAAERLLSLLSHDERFHDEALDLAAEWLARRPGFAPALAAEATVRLARGEQARAARAFAALAGGAAERGRGFLALAAAEAAYVIPGAAREDALRAAEIALAVRRDHVPALRAIRALARASGDREALLRANRRLVAYDGDTASKARAHAELGELLLEADPPGARVHLDHALRLAPDDVDALSALARACAAAGEPLRAVRTLDRLRELLRERGEPEAAAAAAVEAGALWEGPLAHPENALLRYREAAALAPSADVHARAARVAEAVGQWTEAADHHAAVLAAIDRSAPGAPAMEARTRAALAHVAERLGDLAGAALHLEEAAALVDPDPALLGRLAALQRSLGRPAALAATLDRLAALEPDPAARAAMLAEAAEAMLADGRAGDAAARFAAAAAADPSCRRALLGLVRLARERGDPVAERDALERLLPLCVAGADRAEALDPLALACERAGDLAAALEAATEAWRAAPAADRLETALRLSRRVDDPSTLAALLAERARWAAEAGDSAAATGAWLEAAGVLAPLSPASALAALAEARASSPGDAAVLRAQADLGEQAGELPLVLGCLRELLAGRPDDAPALELRAARAALASGDVQRAREHADRALSCGAPGAAEVLDQLLERVDDDGARADILVRLGRDLEAARVLERRGDARAARAALERAAVHPDTAAEALASLADLRLAEGDRSGAAEALLARARLGHGREAAVLAASAHALAGDPGALDLAIEKDPRFSPALARRAALRAGADPGAALADAEAALAGDAFPEEERAPLLAIAAGAAGAVHDEAAARRHLAAYCELAPGDDAALARLAALHRAAGAPADLEAVLERRLPRAEGPAAAQIRLELSALLAPRDAARATTLALEALERDGASAAALRALTTAPLAAHVTAGTRAALLARLAAHPTATAADVAAALGARAQVLADAGDAEGALEAAREAARLAPEPDELVELRARLALAGGDRAEGARALLERARRARERDEAGAAERLAEAGLAALEAGADGAEEALRAALPLGPARETARAVLEALVRLARERGDDAAEREALPLLVPLLPTGDRPAALLRLSRLALEARDPALGRASAEEARALAPRLLSAVEACEAAARAQGDLAGVAALLAEAALLDPAAAGPRLLERARLLAGLMLPEDADAAYSAALAALPPDRALADEQARLRRNALPGRRAAEPLERFASRAGDPAQAASALRAAAALAFASGDPESALRAARRAHALADDPGHAGPLLARVLYLQGGAAEALLLHRSLLEAGWPGASPKEAAVLCRQTADLAESAGDRELALRALDELLRLRPDDVDAAELRFALEPDRARAARELAAAAGSCRSRRRRALALALAAEDSFACGDHPLGEELFRRALADASDDAALSLAVAQRRATAIATVGDASSPALLDALHDGVDAALAAGERALARDLLERAVAAARERGLLRDAARDLLRLDALATEGGDLAGSAARLLAAGALLRDAGDLAGATEILRRAHASSPRWDEAFRALEDLLRLRGAEATPLLLELLAERAARARPGPERAAALVRLADHQRAAGDHGAAEVALRAALENVPGLREAEDRLLAQLAEEGRVVERARLLLERCARPADDDHQPAQPDAARGSHGARERDALRREAAAVLAASADRHDRELAAGVWRDLVREDPDDDVAAAELAAAYSDRPLALAELLLERARRAAGEPRANRLRAASAALFAAGEEARARTALAEAFDAWPADGAAFAEALRDASEDIDRTDAVLSARARAVPTEAAACHRVRGDVLLAVGRPEEAVLAYEAALAAAPEDGVTLAALAACVAEARGNAAAADLDRRVLARAEADPGALPGEAEAPSRFRIGLALSFGGSLHEAVSHLERAVSLAPFDAHAGLAWSALADARAATGDPAGALAAAHARVERATAFDLDEELRAALEAEAELSRSLGVPPALGPSAVEASEASPHGFEREGEPSSADLALERWLASAEALEQAGAPADEVRAALERAAAADPDSPAPWTMRARVEASAGDPLAAARAHLAAAIRGERDEAAEAALEAARLFAQVGHHAEAARAYRAANHACPGSVPEAVLAAAQARAGKGAPPPAVPPAAADRDEAPVVPIAPAPHAGAPAPEDPPAAGVPADDPRELARDGRARFEQGDHAGAYDRLSRAHAGDPSDLTVARDLSRVAEKLGLFDEYVRAGELCADSIAANDPLAAAARYRHFAEVLRDRLQAPPRAAAMLEKALALVPDDADTRRELIALWAAAPGTAPRALDAWTDVARADPSDVTALSAIASLCDRLAAAGDGARLRERGRLAASLATFLSPSCPPPARGALAPKVPVEVRTSVAVAGATGPLARLLGLLTPWLETLFPADLGRSGASPADRLDPGREPAVAAAFEGASRSLRARPHAVFLSTRPGVEVALENTQPAAIVLGGGAAALDDAALAFLAARTVDLLDHGWALVGKFAPRDTGILLELACRFAGGAPPSLGLPPERAGAFFAVLESQVPPPARARAQELGVAASQELAESDPRALAAALRRTANRVGLLYAGDPGAALRALSLLDRRIETGALDRAQALALPDLRDLALFSLSDPFLELRAALLGEDAAP